MRNCHGIFVWKGSKITFKCEQLALRKKILLKKKWKISCTFGTQIFWAKTRIPPFLGKKIPTICWAKKCEKKVFLAHNITVFFLEKKMERRIFTFFGKKLTLKFPQNNGDTKCFFGKKNTKTLAHKIFLEKKIHSWP